MARRAAVGKAAVYGRWPSKLPMIAHLLSETGVAAMETPNTGWLEADVHQLLLRTLRPFAIAWSPASCPTFKPS